jgi:type IV secretory pathway TrbF-like protein
MLPDTGGLQRPGGKMVLQCYSWVAIFIGTMVIMDYHLMIMVYLAEHHVFFPGKLVIQHENWGYQMAIDRHSQMESNGGVQGWVIALQGCVARNRWGKHIYIYSNPQVVPKQ